MKFGPIFFPAKLTFIVYLPICSLRDTMTFKKPKFIADNAIYQFWIAIIYLMTKLYDDT